MARKLEVEIIASTLGYTKGLTKAGEQTKLFARTVDESSKHIGRSLAFATGGFVAFAGASEFLGKSIDAAREAGVAQRQLGAQMKASGESFAQSKDRIEQAGLALERFGFTSEDSAKALTVLERGTGNITRAISLQGTAANLARAKNIDLADAANVLAKVFGGQETALRRAVPGLDKHAHGLDLIAEAQQRLAGQAKAGTTAAEIFSARLHDTEVIIGTALLPALNKLLGSLGDWLEKMNRSGRLQRDVNEAVKDGTAAFHGILDVVKPLVGAFKDLGDAVGGTRNEVKLLAAAFAAWKITAWVNSIGALAGSVGRVGTNAKTSEAEVVGLRGALTRLGTMAAIAIPIEILLNKGGIDKAVSGFLDKHGLGFLGGTNNVTQAQYNAFTGNTATGPVGPIGRRGGTGNGLTGPIGSPGSISGLPGTVAGRTVGNLTPAQQLQVALARDPNNIGLLNQQAASDRNAIAFLNRLHARGKGPGAAKLASELAGFYSDLTSTLGTIASIQSAAADKVKQARDAAARARAKQLRADIPGSVSGTGYGVDPWMAVGIPGHVSGSGFVGRASYQTPLGLQVALAREQATGSGMGATLRAARAAARRAIASGKLSLQAQIEAWNEIASLNDQLKNTAKAAKDTYRQQRGRAVALAGAQGMGYQYAYAAGPTIHIEHFHSNASNPKALEEELARRANARAHVRRGAR